MFNDRRRAGTACVCIGSSGRRQFIGIVVITVSRIRQSCCRIARAHSPSMHYALSPRTFLFSHYFYTGLRVACGVTGLAFLALAFTTVPAAMTVSIGALCTSLMDLPGPLRHKFNGMLVSVRLCSKITLVISLATPLPWLLGSLLVLTSFLASMMVVYVRIGMPLQ